MVKVRVSPTEIEALKARADLAGVTLSDFVRQAILDGKTPRPKPHRIRHEAIRAINRVGVNLNQLTRLANIGVIDPTFSRDLIHALDDLDEVIRQVIEP